MKNFIKNLPAFLGILIVYNHPVVLSLIIVAYIWWVLYRYFREEFDEWEYAISPMACLLATVSCLCFPLGLIILMISSEIIASDFKKAFKRTIKFHIPVTFPKIEGEN